jgi:glycosyltransferase involved in cell wall biosynthesis
MPNVELSLVIPVYNERENVRPLWDAVRPALDAAGLSWEVVLVDDGSTDGGSEEMAALRREEPRVRVVRIDRNRGQSAAFALGFRHALAPVVVTMDADLQNDPQDIPLLLAALEDSDLAIGWRHERRDPFVKRVSSRIANAVRRGLVGDPFHDVGCSLKAFRRPVLPHLVPFRGAHRFFPILAVMAGFRVREVKVRHHPRARGKTKYGVLNRLLSPLVDCFGVRWLRRRYVGAVPGKEIDA